MLLRALLLMAIVTAAIVTVASAAPAYRTTVSIGKKHSALHGHLQSPYAYCEQNRRVKLFRKRMGVDERLGDGVSESDGSWSIPIARRLAIGSYYAFVAVRTSPEIGVTCKAAKSKVVTVD